MNNSECSRVFSLLSTPLMADACIREKLAVRTAPPGLIPLFPDAKVAGRALPVKHYGSVDIFLEAMLQAQPGDIMCIDDRGRFDQSCIGDLTAMEAKAFGIAALLVFGCHRDTSQLISIELPIFSYGRHPSGPQKLQQRDFSNSIGSAKFDDAEVTNDDYVFIDSDGVIFVKGEHLEQVFATAQEIATTEARQAQLVREGTNLHTQLAFDKYMEKRAKEPSYTFREHLRSMAKSIEE